VSHQRSLPYFYTQTPFVEPENKNTTSHIKLKSQNIQTTEHSYNVPSM